MNPYKSPASSAAEAASLVQSGRLWQVNDGSLWVRDGASLPDVCIYGSEPDRGSERTKLKLVWFSTAGRWIESILHLAPLGTLAWFTSQGVRSVFFFSSVGAAAIALRSLASMIFRSSPGYSRRFLIHCATGNRGRRKNFIVAIATAVFFTVGLMGIRDFRWFGLTERMEMGACYTLLVGLFWFGDWFRGLIFPIACEARGDWFRLKNVHPVAVVRFEEIQQSEGSIK